MIQAHQTKTAINYSYSIYGRRLPMGAVYCKDVDKHGHPTYYLVVDLRPFYAINGTRLDLAGEDAPRLTHRLNFCIEILRPGADKWEHDYLPVWGTFYRHIIKHMLPTRPVDDTISRTVAQSVHERRVGAYTQRPNWGQYEHRSRYNCTEQRVKTALIGTGVKSH